MTPQYSPFRIVPQHGFRRILKEDVRFAPDSGDSAANRVNGWFDTLMLQSGIQTAPRLWLILCALTGFAFGGFAWLLSGSFPATAAAFSFGIILPIMIAVSLRSKRQKKILEQLPATLEELARAAQGGRNLVGSLQAVAADTPTPLGDELRLAVRRCDMGIDPGTAVNDLPDRTGVPAMTMLSSAINVHQDTGGNLVQLLERLATATRDRLHYASRLRAATIASRYGAIMMLIIPPMIILIYLYRDPAYLERLLSSFPGRLSLSIAVFLQLTGAAFVFRILKRCARF